MDVQSKQTKRRPADESLAGPRVSWSCTPRRPTRGMGAALQYLGAPTPQVSGAVDSDDAGLLTCGTPVNQPCG